MEYKNLNFLIIKKINIFLFDLPLLKEFVLKDSLISSRKGILVEFITKNSEKYYGEASPLIYFSKESFDDCLNQIIGIKKIMTDSPQKFIIASLTENKKYDMRDFNKFFNASFLDTLSSYDTFKDINKILPSVRYCFEMLYFVIFIKTLNQKGLFHIKKKSYIPLCRLITDIRLIDYRLLEEEIRRGRLNAIKIKIGRHKISEEVSALKKLANIIKRNNRENISLRLDPNMIIPASDAVKVFKKFSQLNVDFIEDPVQDTSLYWDLHKQTGINIAADETLKDFIDFKEKSFYRNAENFLKAIIIKPQIFGGFIATFKLLEMSKNKKIKTVISNIFETNISISAISIFIYFINREGTAEGLGTLDAFLKHPGTIDIKSEEGKLSVFKAFNNLSQIDYSILKKLNS